LDSTLATLTSNVRLQRICYLTVIVLPEGRALQTENQQDDPHLEALQPPGIELHSIDYFPQSERHGKVSHLGAIWFVGNINLTAMATGVVALRERSPSASSRWRLS